MITTCSSSVARVVRAAGAVRIRSAIALLVVSLFVAACSGTVRQTAKEAAPGAVEGAIDTAHEPENRREIADILGDPKIREALLSLTHGIVTGAIDSMTEPERVAKLEALTEAMVQRMGKGLAKSMTDELRPQIAAIVAESTDRALQQMLSAETQQRATEFTVAVSRAATRGITEELGATDATNANGRAGSSRIDALAKQLSNAFAVGFEDAVDRSMVRRNQGHERDAPVLASLGRAATTSFDILSLGGAIAVLLFLGLVGALVALFVRARRYRRESELRDNVLSNLLRLHPELTSREVHAGS